MTRVRGYFFVVARWMDGGWRQTSRSTSAYILRAMYMGREDKCDLIIFTQCYLLREAYLCALCVYLVLNSHFQLYIKSRAHAFCTLTALLARNNARNSASILQMLESWTQEESVSLLVSGVDRTLNLRVGKGVLFREVSSQFRSVLM